MRLDSPLCPECGEPAIGTLDTIQGVAMFDGDPSKGLVEYSGGTKISWDTQQVRHDNQGQVFVTCDNADTWWSRIAI